MLMRLDADRLPAEIHSLVATKRSSWAKVQFLGCPWIP